MKAKTYIDQTRDSVLAIMQSPTVSAKDKLHAAKLMVDIAKVRKHKKHKSHKRDAPVQSKDIGNLISKLEQ